MSNPPDIQKSGSPEKTKNELEALLNDGDIPTGSRRTVVLDGQSATSPAGYLAPTPESSRTEIKISLMDKILIVLSIASQLIGASAIIYVAPSHREILLCEGIAIATTQFLMGFTTTLNSKIWNCIFAVTNAAIIAGGWYLSG